MAASSKFDLLSSSDRQSYSCGPRGPNSGTLLARSGSFHVSMESPIFSSAPSTPRSNSTATLGDVDKYFQCLRVDPKSLVVDPKFHRHSELKKIISVAPGISPDNPPPISSKGKLPSSLYPEDLKRTKAGLRACAARARERRKIFSEALSVFNKFFPTIPTKKRSRSDVISGDRASSISSVDRSGLGANIPKIGTVSHATANAFEAEQQRLEDRANTTTMNKRIRTSLLDARANAMTRPSTNVDFNKDVVQVGKGGAILGEDHVPMGVHGWQNPKMKKKRSGIKADASPRKLSAKSVNGNRELKQGLKHRLVSESRSRINESDASRMVTGTGAVGQGKLDGAFYHSGSGARSAIKSDQDNTELLTQNKDRPSSSDKERVKLKPVNKVSLREDHNSASPTSSMRLAPSARGPRSNSAAFLKSSPIAQRPTNTNDWEVSQCTNRPSTSSGASNQKRTFSARSSSPPVAHWAGQRPQKISRTARRTNFSSIVPSNENSPTFDTNSENRNDNDLMFTRHLSSGSPQQTKSKGDHATLAAISDSEESGVAEKKPQVKKKFFEIKKDNGESSEKTSIFVPVSRKNKLVSGDELLDSVHRQGRTNRNLSSSSRLLMPKVDKFGNVRTAKQLRTPKKSLHKADSKVGRPPTRKLSDRKAYMRNKNLVVHPTADFLGLGDGQEELLAAAKAVASSSHANSYWRHMEPAFRFISEADTAFLKSQLEESNKFSTNFNELGLTESERCASFRETGSGAHEHFSKKLMFETAPDSADPLFERLMGALITDEEDVDRDFQPEDFQVDTVNFGYPKDSEPDFGSLNQALSGMPRAFMSGASTDCGLDGSGRMIIGLEEHENQYACNPLCNSVLPNSDLISIMETTEYQYANMTIHERLLMELQSFGIVHDKSQFRLTNPKELRHLEDQYHALDDKKKGILSKVLTSASGIREVQDKEFERCAMEKLTTMAYEKYMACFGGKSKVLKQAAFSFVLRTLEFCHKYEATGTSCFNESSFKDMFNAALTHLSEAQFSDTISDNESNRGGCSSLWDFQNTLVSQTTDIYSSNSLLPENFSLEQNMGSGDALSNKVKKRELSLDVVGGNTTYPPNGLSVVGGSVKGKRSDRDREGKGNVGLRNGVAKVGRPAGGSTKGVRKPKAKAKVKMSPISASVNGLLASEQPGTTFSSLLKSTENTNNSKEKDGSGLNGANPDADLSNLQIPGMDIDLDDEGEDLASWLNIDDDGLQDHDFLGLEIPMDDLADVHMMF